jgi:hypothetical protein
LAAFGRAGADGCIQVQARPDTGKAVEVIVEPAEEEATEQVMGTPGQAADTFAWGLTVAYAASGTQPFGTGPVEVLIYRVVHEDPNVAAVPADRGRWSRPRRPRIRMPVRPPAISSRG